MRKVSDEVTKAIEAWVTVYTLAKKINLAQALEALDGLARSNGFENFEALKEKIL